MAEGTRGQENRKFEETVRSLLKEQKEQFEKEIGALKSLVLEVCNQQSQGQHGSPQASETGQRNSYGGGYQVPTRFSCIKFPKFNGEGFKSWLYKCDQFFEVDETPSEAKVRIAAMHLEGKALQCHQVFMKARISRDPPAWEEYVKALGSRFGDCLYDDPMGDLKGLRQTRSVREYQDAFEEFLNRVDLPESYAVSCFIRGLKEEIQLAVRMFTPRDLQHVVGLAKIEEAKTQNSIRQGRYNGPSNFSGPYSKGGNGSFTYPGNTSTSDLPLLPRPGGRNEEQKKLS